MVDPLLALVIFAALSLLLGLALWPGRGVVPRLARLARMDERVRIEDALKHAYTCERRGRACTLESVAGQLGISTAQAATLLSRLASMGMVRNEGDTTLLTEEGRSSALRVVRTHRLWERYLADRTGVPAGEWHDEAEQKEHLLTPEETEELAARLGHPRWDPHGDPIPTSEGELPPARGENLLGVEPGRAVEIVHLEDEPRAVFETLVEQGLALGGRLDVRERTDTGVTVGTAGRSWEIDAVAARNVTVRLLPEGMTAEGLRRTLLEVPRGETARVAGISDACRGPQRRRLLDLGLVRGTEVTPELVSAGGDPVAYRIREALIALRREQATWILVEDAPAASREVA